jgi:hypothetical protein
MSLNYHLDGIENWQELQEGEPWIITEKIIFATMTVDIGRISEHNYEEFYVRTIIADRMSGYPNPRFTLEDVKRRIGLCTNVKNEPYSSWLKRWYKYEHAEILREAKKERIPQ